jgi:hypothetical protein
MLMNVARTPALTNPGHGQDLPPCWRARYELTKLTRFDAVDPTIRTYVAVLHDYLIKRFRNVDSYWLKKQLVYHNNAIINCDSQRIV